MNRKAQGIIEIALIAMLVAVVVFGGWKLFGKLGQNVASLSAVKVNNSAAEALVAKIKGLNKSDPDYIQQRIETSGALGQLIAKYKNSNTGLQALITEGLKGLDPDVDTEACIASPSSCTALSTISDFSWKLGSSTNPMPLSSTYNGKKIPVTLTYTYSYVDDSGKLVSDEKIVQDAYVQKEQNAAYKNQTFSSFLTKYMNSKFTDSAFTGASDDVQANLDSYLTGRNCVLSKSDTEDVDFVDPE